MICFGHLSLRTSWNKPVVLENEPLPSFLDSQEGNMSLELGCFRGRVLTSNPGNRKRFTGHRATGQAVLVYARERVEQDHHEDHARFDSRYRTDVDVRLPMRQSAYSQ